MQSFGSSDSLFDHCSWMKANRQSKIATSPAVGRGPLVVDDGMFRVPFSHRHDPEVALQHSRRQGGFTEALQKVSLEQFLVQPAVHCILSDIFFSCTTKNHKNKKRGKKRKEMSKIIWKQCVKYFLFATHNQCFLFHCNYHIFFLFLIGFGSLTWQCSSEEEQVWKDWNVL